MMNDGPLDDDPFDDDFFPSKSRIVAGGVLSVLLSIVLTVVFYGLLLAVLLAVGFWVAQQFGILMLGMVIV